jgi:sugar phosphate permease
MMSGFHGMFSLGGIVGAAGVAALLALGVSTLASVAVVLGLIAIALLISVPSLLSYGGNSDGPLFAFPRGVVLLIGIVCFIVFMMEGSVLDWSAVFLSTHHQMAKEHSGLGYAAFACAMTIGRLTGDRIVQRLGSYRVVKFGGICAAVGVAVTLVPSWPLGLLGYLLVGAGCSNIVPVMFSATGRQTVMPESLAVPAISTLGYAGVLAGPAAIGFISHISSL